MTVMLGKDRGEYRHLRASRTVVVFGVVILAWSGFEFNHDTPWAYLNVIAATVLVMFARGIRLKSWPMVIALPLWSLIEVSIYYPWVDPGIPISMFINPVVGLVVLIGVLISPVVEDAEAEG